MAWISLSRTWSTGSTTTTSRKLQKRKTEYLRLQADPRLKQNQEDFQLLAHLQGLYLVLKENGLILSQELNSIKLTQWQKNKHSFSTRRRRSYTAGQCTNSEQFLRVHLSRPGCAINLHSITNSGLILGGQNLRRYSFTSRELHA